MFYINRAIEHKILETTPFYPVIVVWGPRQVGKSTTLRHIKEPERTYVSLKINQNLILAKQNPDIFFEQYKPPIIIDEFQLAPELLSAIQYIIDEKETQGEDCNGMFWLTGSNKVAMEAHIGESLSGRCAVFDMPSLSYAELAGQNVGIFNPDVEVLKNRASHFPPKDESEILDRILFGSMPNLYKYKEKAHDMYYRSYLETYLVKDIRALLTSSDVSAFKKFIQYMAEYTGQQLNYETLTSTFQRKKSVLEDWVSILERLGVICIIPPYEKTAENKMRKNSKFYFMDTGFAAYLCGIRSVEDMYNKNKQGAIFETYVVSEIVKSFYNDGKDISTLYWYRDTNQSEIDLIIAGENNKIYPIEIKLNSAPSKATKNISSIERNMTEDERKGVEKYSQLDKLKMDVQPAIIICQTGLMKQYGNKAWLYPISAL